MPSTPLICCSSGVVTGFDGLRAGADIEAGYGDLRRRQRGKLSDRHWESRRRLPE